MSEQYSTLQLLHGNHHNKSHLSAATTTTATTNCHLANGVVQPQPNRTSSESSVASRSVPSHSMASHHSRATSIDVFAKQIQKDRPQNLQIRKNRILSEDFEDPSRHFSIDDDGDDLDSVRPGGMATCHEFSINKQINNRNLRNSHLLKFIHEEPFKNTSQQQLQQLASSPTPVSGRSITRQTDDYHQYKQQQQQQVQTQQQPTSEERYFISQHQFSKGMSDNLQQVCFQSYEKNDGILLDECMVGSQILEVRPVGYHHQTILIKDLPILLNSLIEQPIVMSNGQIQQHFEQSIEKSSLLEKDQPSMSVQSFSAISIFFSIAVQLSTCGFQSMFLLPLISTSVTAIAYGATIISLILQHSFYKITQQRAKKADSMQLVIFFYFGAIFVCASTLGAAFRDINESYRLNWLSSLPLLSAILFVFFSMLLASLQPTLLKRLKVSYGNQFERKLTLTQSKSLRRGMTFHRLPEHLTKFQPDLQGPQFSSLKFYLSTALCVCLVYCLVFYAMNQWTLWWSLMRDNGWYNVVMMVCFLVISEVVLKGILSRLEKKLGIDMQVEMDLLRCVFSVSLYRLFLLEAKRLLIGGAVIVVKLLFKWIAWYLYPTQSDSLWKKLELRIKGGIAASDAGENDAGLQLSQNPIQLEDKEEVQRNDLMRNICVRTYTDVISMVIFIGGLTCLRGAASKMNTNIHEFSRHSWEEFVGIIGICAAELVVDSISTFFILKCLAKNRKYYGFTMKVVNKKLAELLIDRKGSTFFAFLAVSSVISLVLANNTVSNGD